jgi:dynein heavy chain 1
LWIGGFFGPQAFITATRQFSAAKNGWALEQTVLRFEARDHATPEEYGFLLTGVRVEGAVLQQDVIETSPVLAYAIPLVVLRWTKGDERAKEGLVQLPVYLNSTRREQIFRVNLKGKSAGALYQRGVDLVLSALAGSS